MVRKDPFKTFCLQEKEKDAFIAEGNLRLRKVMVN